MEMFIKGKVSAIKRQEYEGQKTIKLQFLNEDEEKGFSILEVKVLPEHMNSELMKNSGVVVPFSISCVNGKVYYRTNGKIQVLNK